MLIFKSSLKGDILKRQIDFGVLVKIGPFLN